LSDTNDPLLESIPFSYVDMLRHFMSNVGKIFINEAAAPTLNSYWRLKAVEMNTEGYISVFINQFNSSMGFSEETREIKVKDAYTILQESMGELSRTLLSQMTQMLQASQNDIMENTRKSIFSSLGHVYTHMSQQPMSNGSINTQLPYMYYTQNVAYGSTNMNPGFFEAIASAKHVCSSRLATTEECKVVEEQDFMIRFKKVDTILTGMNQGIIQKA
jgi:hypothetical protein